MSTPTLQGRVRAENGRIIVIGEKSDKTALDELMKGRAQLMGALDIAMYLQESELELTPQRAQRQFIESDAVHVLKSWFDAKYKLMDKDASPTGKCSFSRDDIHVTHSMGSYPAARSDWVGKVKFPTGWGMPCVIEGDSRKTKESAQVGYQFFGNLHLLVLHPDHPLNNTQLYIQLPTARRPCELTPQFPTIITHQDAAAYKACVALLENGELGKLASSSASLVAILWCGV